MSAGPGHCSHGKDADVTGPASHPALTPGTEGCSLRVAVSPAASNHSVGSCLVTTASYSSDCSGLHCLLTLAWCQQGLVLKM